VQASDRARERVSVDRDAIVASLDAFESSFLGDEMRSIVLDHGRRAARVTVLLHGLTASPRTWREFAGVRFERGENVLIPRLPRHGHADRMSEALAGLTSDELSLQGRRIVDAAAQLGDEIVLVGHSLGGAVALHLAHEDVRVSRTLAVAPFLGIKRVPRDWHAWVRSLLERTPNRFLYWNPIERGRGVPEHGYHRYTTRSLAAGLALADALREDARRGPPRSPRIEIVRNAGETSVSNAAIDDLVARWRAAGGAGVRVHRLVGLGRSHDIVEPERRGAPALRFLPFLHAILDAPPAERDTVIDAGDAP
jgi:pimeloyl-ACP methyl ester carboxylesterase